MDPLIWWPRGPDRNDRLRLALTIMYLLALAILLLIGLLSGGCAVSYQPGRGYRAVLGCVNLTGPGLTLSCPENVQAPELPNSNVPAGPTDRP